MLNRLAGADVQAVQAVRLDDDHGRHTTTSRTLFALPSGGLIMDTPGMRELQLWDTEDGLDDTFSDILTLSQHCRFTDCTHQTEPGCAIADAIATGQLQQERFNSFHKLQRELAFIARKEDRRAREAQRDQWKNRTMAQRQRGNRPEA